MINIKFRYLNYPLLFILSIFASCLAGYSQVSGCKDPTANNYNSSATINDGSCTYNTTTYTPPVKVDPLSATLAENSGLQMAGNFLWSFNDGGNAAAIYRIDTVTNAILQTVNLGGTVNIDWEDMAFDGTYFYIGDFGNNADGARTDLKIYKFPLSAIPDYTTDPVTTISAGQTEIINFSYSDQIPVVATGANNTKFDCEAMIVEDGKIHLFSKNWIDVNSTHYVINSITAGIYIATPLETLPTGYLVTAADKVPGANVIVLLGYQNGIPGNHYMHVLSDFSAGFYFNGNKRKLDLPNALTMGQAEGICFRNATYGYISSERISSPFTITQKLRSFNIAGYLPAYLFLLPLELTNFNVTNRSGKHQIDWSFASPVTNLKLLQSSDNRNFSAIENLLITTKGSFYYEPVTKTNCYRLMWQQANRSNTYSTTICLNGEVKNGLNNFVLHSNGEMNFISSDNDVYVLRLISVDGKTVAAIPKQAVLAGTNNIQFLKTLPAGNIMLLQATGSKGQTSHLVRIQN